jgi:hypothetical protein
MSCVVRKAGNTRLVQHFQTRQLARSLATRFPSNDSLHTLPQPFRRRGVCFFVNETDQDPSLGIWGVICVLGVCAMTALAIPNFLPRRTHCCMNACINNLRQMDGAIQQWALENQRKPEDKITLTDISPFVITQMVCPQGGKYTVGPAVSNVPSCSIAGHVLPR